MFWLFLSTALALSTTSKNILKSEFPSAHTILNHLPLKTIEKIQVLSSTADVCIEVDPTLAYYPCTDIECTCHSSETGLACTTRDVKRDSDLCPEYHRQDSNCTLEAPCFRGLFCNFTFTETIGECLERRQITCENTDECIEGKVCNDNKCVKQYSLDAGESATTRIACKSAIVKDGICQKFEETDGKFPKKCQNNGDCASVDDAENDFVKTDGVCICIGEFGNYCQLHRSDQLVKDFLVASIEDRIGEFMWLSERISMYPLYELDYADKTFEGFEYFNNVTEIKENAECSGFWIASSTLLALAIYI